MRFNEREASEILNTAVIDQEGRLNFRKVSLGSYNQAAFKERWFKLKGNLLFYFRINDFGSVDDKLPTGLIVLENCNVQPEWNSGAPFAFSLTFSDEPDKKLIFSARCDADVQKWISALKQSSYEYWRQQLILLQSKISFRTGVDPLLLYPRNQGVVRNVHQSEDLISHRESSFQSHMLASSTASLSINAVSNSVPLHLARSASSTSALLKPIIPPPRMNALSRSASSSQANRPIIPPPRASRSQLRVSPTPQSGTVAESIQNSSSQANGYAGDDSPNLIEL